MEFMAEAGEETLDAWTTTQSSLREYCICVTRALDRAREGAGEKLSTSLVVFITYLSS